MKTQPLLTETAVPFLSLLLLLQQFSSVQFTSGLHYDLVCAFNSDGNKIQNEGKILMLLQTSFLPEILPGTSWKMGSGVKCKMKKVAYTAYGIHKIQQV